MSYSQRDELKHTIKQLTVQGKGILAADESVSALGNRFKLIKVDNTDENRKSQRTMLFSSANLEKQVSGVILHDETFTQNVYNNSDKKITDLLTDKNIVPGVKVDKGISEIEFTDDEVLTLGLDGLKERCENYQNHKARFAKWRGVIKIDEKKDKPSSLAIEMNTETIARMAAICQATGLVPLIEPEVLSDGDHDIETCAKVTERVWTEMVYKLLRHRVLLDCILIMPNMVLPGHDNPKKDAVSNELIATQTIKVLSRTIPPAIRGIQFLSGGQSELDATNNLQAVNQLAQKTSYAPWKLAFGFGRALQHSSMMVWNGQDSNVAVAQQEFIHKCKANQDASLAKFTNAN